MVTWLCFVEQWLSRGYKKEEVFLLTFRFIQKGEKTDLVAEIGRFFKQNIYLLVQIIVCLAPFVSKGLYEV